jgi:hypothetical protein
MISDEDRDTIINALKEVHGNNLKMMLILDTPNESSINLALQTQQALMDVLGAGANVLVQPASETMFIRIEEGPQIRTFNVHSLKKFDDLVREVHEPLAQANPNYKNPYYIFGVAIEKVLMDNFLVFNGQATS